MKTFKSIYDFGWRDVTVVDMSKMEEYRKTFRLVDNKDKKCDNPQFGWIVVCAKGDDKKYGRVAVSEAYKLRRGLTMGEFYGDSAVD